MALLLGKFSILPKQLQIYDSTREISNFDWRIFFYLEFFHTRNVTMFGAKLYMLWKKKSKSKFLFCLVNEDNSVAGNNLSPQIHKYFTLHILRCFLWSPSIEIWWTLHWIKSVKEAILEIQLEKDKIKYEILLK